jgi:2-oxoglutarate ferredoxin oxidoreductase subunit beta
MLHGRDLVDAIEQALQRRGFSFIEVLSPCPVNFGRRNKEKSLQTLINYRDKTIVKNGANPADLGIDFDKGVVLGTFIDIDKPTADEIYREMHWPENAHGDEHQAG